MSSLSFLEGEGKRRSQIELGVRGLNEPARDASFGRLAA